MMRYTSKTKSIQLVILCSYVCFLIASAWTVPSLNHCVATKNTSLGSRVCYSKKYAVRSIGSSLSRHSYLLGVKGNNSGDDTILPSEKDQLALGLVGTKMSLVMLLSEYVLKTTACGLPAGPYGVIGAVEGLSYLGVTSLVALSLYCKVTTGSGLPSGPKGILGLAEGMSYLAVMIGIIVLVYQVRDFGYIPNAVPMEGGMCR
jgi:hypothetical protein